MPDPVFVDPLTELYHNRREHAGDAATRYSRPQAERFGFGECPTCRHADRVADTEAEPAKTEGVSIPRRPEESEA